MRTRVSISKFLSLVLRHRPSVIGIELDEGGWADISVLVEKANKSGGIPLTASLVRQVVEFSDKQRFAISTDGLRIRANQGHSINVELNLDELPPPELLFHGTASRNLLAIHQQGIIKGSRQYVHLSQDRETAEAVGKRYGVPVVLTVHARSMSQDGYKFYLSENGVWLTDVVPKNYITGFVKSHK